MQLPDDHAAERTEFCRENDRRTMKGWHLHVHLSYEVANAGFGRQPASWRFYRYVVDANGTLRTLRAVPPSAQRGPGGELPRDAREVLSR